jgi:beta-glucanase (GH16 family)
MEIRAKIPGGDWLWPALWLLPTNEVYGGWPRSGEIDLMEARSNLNLMDGAMHVGSEQVGSTMHFGPRSDFNGWPTAHYTRNQRPAFHTGFHRYRVRWTDSYIQFFVDDVPIGTVNAGTGKKRNFRDFKENFQTQIYQIPLVFKKNFPPNPKIY